MYSSAGICSLHRQLYLLFHCVVSVLYSRIQNHKSNYAKCYIPVSLTYPCVHERSAHTKGVVFFLSFEHGACL